MKRITKILITVLSAFCLCFGSACNMLDDWGALVPPSKRPSTTFTVEYDYGQITEGKAILLLSGSTLFFDPEEYGVAPLIAGDEIEVTYDGEMLIQETYPSTVVFNGNIETIRKGKTAFTMDISFNGVEDGKIVGSNGYTFSDLPKYVIEKDNTLTPLSEVAIGTPLTIAYRLDCEGEGDGDVLVTAFKPTAIYTYSHDYPLTAKEVIPWAAELSAEEIIEVEEKSFNASVGPNGFSYIRKTQDKGQIENLLSYFQGVGYREAVNGEEEIDGGGTIVYTLRTADEEYIYSTYAGYYSNENGCYYPQRQAPMIVGEELYQFFMTDKECTLFVEGKEVKTYPQGLTEYVFKRIQEEPIFPAKKYVLECGNWHLYLMDERKFILNFQGSDELFELVGEKDFSEIFAEYGKNG